MRRRRGMTAVGAAIAALSMLAAAAGASAAAPRSFYGVVPQTELTTEDIDRMGQARVGTLRFEISWGGIDPSPASGDYQFGATDAVVGAAARNGIVALPFVYSTPEWAAKLDGRNCSGNECYPFAPARADALAAWEQFMRDLVARYGPGGQFWIQNPTLPARPIRTWQVWNEQNSPSFYKPEPNVKRYAKLLAASDAGVSGDPGAEVILGGMFGTPLGGRKPGIAAWDFLERLYDVRGAKRQFDGVAPHPYASKLKKVRAQMDLIRDALRSGGDRNVGLWITELGWASGGPPNPLNRGLQGQATRLKQAFKFFTRKRRAWNVETVNWYSWRDNPNANAGLCEWCPESGLLDEDGTEKPAFKAFVKLTGGS